MSPPVWHPGRDHVPWDPGALTPAWEEASRCLPMSQGRAFISCRVRREDGGCTTVRAQCTFPDNGRPSPPLPWSDWPPTNSGPPPQGGLPLREVRAPPDRKGHAPSWGTLSLGTPAVVPWGSWGMRGTSLAGWDRRTQGLPFFFFDNISFNSSTWRVRFINFMGLLCTFNKVTTVQYHLVSHSQECTFELFKHNPHN